MVSSSFEGEFRSFESCGGVADQPLRLRHIPVSTPAPPDGPCGKSQVLLLVCAVYSAPFLLYSFFCELSLGHGEQRETLAVVGFRYHATAVTAATNVAAFAIVAVVAAGVAVAAAVAAAARPNLSASAVASASSACHRHGSVVVLPCDAVAIERPLCIPLGSVEPAQLEVDQTSVYVQQRFGLAHAALVKTAESFDFLFPFAVLDLVVLGGVLACLPLVRGDNQVQEPGVVPRFRSLKIFGGKESVALVAHVVAAGKPLVEGARRGCGGEALSLLPLLSALLHLRALGHEGQRRAHVHQFKLYF
mmetsp:Transcript_21702/g.42920  ORF Transcript_21702/g.42920 Transcript_21702/m.42920 type:complete len:304 (+) Transcript_21702:744-1655(+)